MGAKNSILVSLVVLLLCSCTNTSGTKAAQTGLRSDSELTLWAWHGAHDLRFLADRDADARSVSVAYLARRLVVRPQGVEAQLRSSALLVPAKMPLTAVVRIEIESSLSAASFLRVLPRLIEHLSIAAAENDVATLQIDFDAPARLRPQYRQLLREVRKQLPLGHRLEMTALASWCLDDRWIDDGLVDAVVPMLFEMGPESKAIRRRLQGIDALPAALCKEQLGVSTTDVLPPLLGAKRVFVFAPGPWTFERLERVEKDLTSGVWTR